MLHGLLTNKKKNSNQQKFRDRLYLPHYDIFGGQGGIFKSRRKIPKLTKMEGFQAKNKFEDPLSSAL